MASSIGSVFDKWIELLKAQTTLTADLVTELITAVQGGVRGGGGALRFSVSRTMVGNSGPQNNPTIFLPGVATGNIAAPAGFHSSAGGTISAARLTKTEVKPNQWQFSLTNVAADNPNEGLYVGIVVNTSNQDVIASVVITVVA